MTRTKLIKSEVIQLFKTTKETLRYYEQMGILKPEVSDNNYRYYDFDDLQKLREIFLLRDLDLSLEEIKQLDDGLVNKGDYIELLKSNHKTLQEKIQYFQDIQGNVEQLIEVLEKKDKTFSYHFREKKERHYHVLDPIETECMGSPKAFFDSYKTLIKNNNYSERTLQMIYPYDLLGSGKKINAKVCMELPNNFKELTKKSQDLIIFPAGTYLSIFYPFRDGGFDMLPSLKTEIEKVFKEKTIIRKGTIVLEKEHLELSLFLDKDTTIFELQIHIERE